MESRLKSDAMAHMTEEEAERLDELYTRTTPEIDPDKKGLLSRQKETPVFDVFE